MILPRYPIYVISKGRPDRCLTARFLRADGVPFRLVVEPQEADLYRARYGDDVLIVTPEAFSARGQGSIPVRNFVWEHALAEGHARHWILDDNVRDVYRWYKGERVRCNAGPAMAAAEEFTERYTNIGIMGFNYMKFGTGTKVPPFYLNVHVYSFMLIRNDLPQRWRGRYNEDTDLCLQVLAAGWCTVLLNVFLADKMTTLTMPGGNMESLYLGDGRLRMARALQRQWPKVVETRRRFKRPQHVVAYQWRRFDTPLERRPDLVLPDGPDEFGLRLHATAPVKSPRLRRLLADAGVEHETPDG